MIIEFIQMKDPTFLVIPALLAALTYYMLRMNAHEKRRKKLVQPRLEVSEISIENSDYMPKKSIIPYLLLFLGFCLGFIMAPMCYLLGSLGLVSWMVCLSLVFIVGGWKLL